MEVIYIDTLFFLDLLADYLLLLSAARISGLVLKRKRYFFSALLGAAYSVLVYVPGFAFLAHWLWKLCFAALMCFIAFGREAAPLRCTGVFLAVSAAFGGAVWAIGLAGGTVGRLSLRVLSLSFAIFYAVFRILFRSRAKAAERTRLQVELCFMGRCSRFTALSDSGNILTEPISGMPVMVLSPHAAAPLLPELAGELECCDGVTLLEKAAAIPGLAGKLRLVSCRTVGGGGMLPVFRPDSVTVNGKEETKLLAAISRYAGGDGFEAII